MAYIEKEPLCAWLENMNVSDFIIRRIKSEAHFPTADVVEVKHGEWIRPTKLADMMHDIPHCSLCGEVPCDEGKYCPYCGAKMDGGKAE